METRQVRPLLCHPAETVVRNGFRASCPRCGSFWDLESCREAERYGEDYPARHKHLDPQIGRLKVATLSRWLSALTIDLAQHVVCEVGFGGGFCLAHVHTHARAVYGVEVVPQSLAHAVSLGVPRPHLFLFDERPRELPSPVSLWLFQDSFEHVLDVDRFLPWVAANSSAGALALVVAPNAASLSRRLLGRYWPHKLPEHLFHWSERGLIETWRLHGFDLRRRFRTTKQVSTDQLTGHLQLTTSLRALGPLLSRVVPDLEFPFNIGEMGLLFERRDRSAS